MGPASCPAPGYKHKNYIAQGKELSSKRPFPEDATGTFTPVAPVCVISPLVASLLAALPYLVCSTVNKFS